MNVRKFTARTSREALALVKQAFGADAVVLSNKSVPEGVEVLAMAPEGMGQIEQIAQSAPRTVARAPVQQPQGQLPSRAPFNERARQEPSFGAPEVQHDVEQLAMSTLSFQDYVRERVLRRRQAEMSGQPDPVAVRPRARAAAATRRVAGRRPCPARAACRRGHGRAGAQACRPGTCTATVPPSAHGAAGAARRDPHPDRPVRRQPAARRAPAQRHWCRAPATPRPAQRQPAQPDGHGLRAAPDAWPHRRTLLVAGLHGEAAAPARAGAPDTEAAGAGLLAGAGAQAGRELPVGVQGGFARRARRRDRLGGPCAVAKPADR